MEVELLENGSSPGKHPSSQRKLDKDAAVMARFGKHPQLRVSVSISFPWANFITYL